MNDLTKYQDSYIPQNLGAIDTKELREQEYWKDVENDVTKMMKSGTSADPNSFSQSNIQNLVSSVSNSFNTPICDENCVWEGSRRGLGCSWGTLGDSRWAQEWILMDLWSILGSLFGCFLTKNMFLLEIC